MSTIIMPKEIYISGRPITNVWNVVRLDGHEIALAGTSFRLLSILSLARLSNENEGWVSTIDFYPQNIELVHRYLYRLKIDIRRNIGVTAELTSQIKELIKWPIFENDGQRHYRLVADPEGITYSEEQLRGYGDAEIDKYLKLL